MGFFHLHRTSSSSSSCSASSAYSSATSYTPRTSTDSADDYMSATLKPQSTPPRAPLLDLPFEILQHIASYLDDASASVFSLSSRQLCYALGTQRLSNYISSSPSRFDARERLEETIERALPGAWHCAWCSKFHLWSSSNTPSSLRRGVQLPCAEYNSYLTDGTGYTLQYAHIRLALAHARFGPSHGLPLSSFSHSRSGSIKLFRTLMQTSISHDAKITQARFLLHTNYSILLPTWAAQHKNLIGHLWPLLPPLLTQHRASEYGHSGLMAALDNVVRRGWRVVGAQSCSDCSTDWSVSACTVPRSVAGEFVRVNVRIWRDLGCGASPFESGWRAHGPYIPGTEDSCVREEMRRERGSVRDAFEHSAWVGEERGEKGMCGVDSEWETLAYSWQVEKKKEDERDQEREWRAIWKYIERRAGVEAGKS